MKNKGNYVPREISVRGLEGHWLSGGILFVTLKDKRSVNMVLLSQNEQLVKIGFVVGLCYVLTSSQVNMMMRKVTINPCSSLLF